MNLVSVCEILRDRWILDRQLAFKLDISTQKRSRIVSDRKANENDHIFIQEMFLTLTYILSLCSPVVNSNVRNFVVTLFKKVNLCYCIINLFWWLWQFLLDFYSHHNNWARKLEKYKFWSQIFKISAALVRQVICLSKINGTFIMLWISWPVN